MCGLRIFLSALLFSLALGPYVMLLHAQDTERPDNDVSTESSLVTGTGKESTDSEDLDVTENPADATSAPEIVESTDPITVPNSSTISETEPPTTSSEELPTTTEPPVTTVTTTTMATTIMMTTIVMEPSTEMVTEFTDPESATVLLEDTTVASEAITTVHAPPPAIQTTAPTTVHESTKASETTETLIMTTETIEEPTPSTTEITDTIATLSPIIPFSLEPTDVTIEDTEEPSTSTSISASSEAITALIGIVGTGSKSTEQDSGPNWLLYIIIAVAIICIASAFCVIIFVRRKKKSRSQRFGSGYMNGRNQRSKKKKGEEDAWAGPVNLEGVDKAECEGPEELGKGSDKHPDGTDLTLSTFVASEANGGVGRPGSMEVQKWEEQEPLLYIDEDAKAEAKEKQNEGVEKEKEVGQKEEKDDNGKTAMKEVKQNGGEAFCLTTAV